MGLHGTTDGSLGDVWHWNSVRPGGGFEQNFAKVPDSPYVKLKYLLKNLAALQARMGVFNPDVNVSDTAAFSISKEEVQAYSAEADAARVLDTGSAYDQPIVNESSCGWSFSTMTRFATLGTCIAYV